MRWPGWITALVRKWEQCRAAKRHVNAKRLRFRDALLAQVSPLFAFVKSWRRQSIKLFVGRSETLWIEENHASSFVFSHEWDTRCQFKYCRLFLVLSGDQSNIDQLFPSSPLAMCAAQLGRHRSRWEFVSVWQFEWTFGKCAQSIRQSLTIQLRQPSPCPLLASWFLVTKYWGSGSPWDAWDTKTSWPSPSWS